MAGPISLRPARRGDASEIADLFIAARRGSMSYLPELHSDHETHQWIEHIVLRDCRVTVAMHDAHIAGFAALHAGWLEHLYVVPEMQSRGIGTVLLASAKLSSPGGLQLWVFQQNQRARNFYERHGFRLVELTDGSANEEKVPDALYAWQGN